MFDRYPVPAFVPDDLRRDLPERYPGMAWILASYAIWRDRVLERDDVGPAPGTRTVEV